MSSPTPTTTGHGAHLNAPPRGLTPLQGGHTQKSTTRAKTSRAGRTIPAALTSLCQAPWQMQRRTASGDFDTSDHAVASARPVPVSPGDQPVIQQLYRRHPSLGPAEPRLIIVHSNLLNIMKMRLNARRKITITLLVGHPSIIQSPETQQVTRPEINWPYRKTGIWYRAADKTPLNTGRATDAYRAYVDLFPPGQNDRS